MTQRNHFTRSVALVAGGATVLILWGCGGSGSTSRQTTETTRADFEVEQPSVSEPQVREAEASAATETAPPAPIDPRHAYLDGIAARKEGRLDDAARYLEAATVHDPDHVKSWINLARVRLDLDDPTSALEAAGKALELDAGSAQAMHQRGRGLAALNRWDEAIQVLGVAHETDPDDGWIANTLGWALLQSGRYGDAVPFLEAARERIPEVAFVHNNLGVAYERTGRRDEAIAAYRAAVSKGDSGGKSAASLARLGVPDTDTAIVEGTEPAVEDTLVAAEKP